MENNNEIIVEQISEDEPLGKFDIVNKAEMKEYSKKETIYAWCCFIFGFLLCKIFPFGRASVFEASVLCGLVTLTAFYFKFKKIKFNGVGIASAILSVIFAVSVIFSGYPLLNILSGLLSFALYAFFVYTVTENNINGCFSDLILVDFFKALIILPFSSFVDAIYAAFSKKTKNAVKEIGKFVLGLVLAIVPTVIVISLLSFDNGFRKLIESLFSFNKATVTGNILSLIFGFPLGLYLFGMVSSAESKYCKNQITVESIKNVTKHYKVIPQITAATVALPLIFVYVVFFISQWQYYVGGLLGNLPENFGYAEYAREGFFQLCAVSFINLLIIVVLSVLMKRKDDANPIILRVITVIFTVFTLILIATAIAKMIMYIDSYGLTGKRLFSSIIMIVIAITFIFVAIKQFFKGFKVIPLSLSICLVFTILLTVCDVNGFIVKYNVNRYINGTLKTVDISAAEELGGSAIPALVDLAEYLDEKYNGDISSYKSINANKSTKDMYTELSVLLKNKQNKLKNTKINVLTFNLTKYRALKSLEKINLK